MAQITFRINPKPTYSERMTEARSELRRLIKEQLCELDHARQYRHHVLEPQGVHKERRHSLSRSNRGVAPLGGPLRHLSDVPNLGKLELLLQGWKDGTIRFRQINEEQYLAMLHDPTPWIGPATGTVEPEGDD
ncbi:hypothetical protein NUW54_g10753 [Trametes sanguinea]|uniref:Uncharacterized protein n=1 Tax=Trametes sanguinea TaxID=158606 RepID=A0ACC1NVT4_9APHY|nr:hypothetical protein NUW54_g10753 [Trametes sanguinea]